MCNTVNSSEEKNKSRINEKLIEKIESELQNIFYGEIKLIIKKGKVKFIESKKSIKVRS